MRELGTLRLQGIGVSSGIGIGRIAVIAGLDVAVSKKNACCGELTRFTDALRYLVSALEVKAAAAQGEQAEILESHVMLLSDPMIVSEIEQMITGQNCNSEYAVYEVFEKYKEAFCLSGDDLLMERVSDLQDMKNNLLAVLSGAGLVDVSTMPAETVLAAHELTTSVAAGVKQENISALVTQEGGKTSHMAIIARSIGVPAVVGIPVEQLENGAQVVVNGDTGEVIVNPPKELLAEFLEKQEELRREKLKLERYRGVPSTTQDGKKMELCANIGLDSDIEIAIKADAEGVGLFRTEFLYMNRRAAPTEDEQFAAYKKAAQAFADTSVIIRTLDIGGDKEIPYLDVEKEENPFLGWRAIRYCLDCEELFTAQLRAILRASAFGKIKLMLPMVSSMSELRRAKALIEESKQTLADQGIAFDRNLAVGIMIETPAAAVLADRFAHESDFFSIGTNDLTQYVMAADRGNKNVSHLYCAYDPAVLRLIYQAAQAAKAVGIPCGICGESGSDPLLTKFFIASDISELSMVGASILPIREIVCNTSYEKVKAEVKKSLYALESLEDTVDFLRRL